jgi:hypothetical protein
MALAGGAPMPQVRAIASQQLENLPSVIMAGTATRDDTAFRSLLAADVKRFLERPMAPIASPTTPDAPPGAPIGDTGMNWLAPVGWCAWDGRIYQNQ